VEKPNIVRSGPIFFLSRRRKRGGNSIYPKEVIMFSISEVARRIGVKRFHISYAHQMGYLPEVARFQGSRIYTEEDVRKVEAYFLAKAGRSKRCKGGGGEAG
jgi:hypothetical protein